MDPLAGKATASAPIKTVAAATSPPDAVNAWVCLSEIAATLLFNKHEWNCARIQTRYSQHVSCCYHFPNLSVFIHRRQTMRRIILFLPLFLLACLLSASAVRSQTTTVSNTAELKQALQLKLNEWHKAGSFPRATPGAVLANGESFGLAVGFLDQELKTPMKPDACR